MLSIKNQFNYSFLLGPYPDFISPENLDLFTLKINAGGIRPVINLKFHLENEGLIPYLNQGNKLWCSCAPASKHIFNDIPFLIEGDACNKQYKLGSNVSLIAGLYKPAIFNCKCEKTYEQKTSYEVFKDISEANLNCPFNFMSNALRTNDRQNWYVNGETLWTFMNRSYCEAYKDKNTFFGYGMDCEYLYLMDIREKLKAGVTWTLSMKHATNLDSNVINIGSYFPDESRVGKMGDLAGKNDKVVGFDVDSGEYTEPSYNLQSYTTMGTTDLNMNTEGEKNYTYSFTNGEKHEHYLEAINQNKRNNILFSSYKVYVPIPHEYVPFRLFDVVKLIPNDTDKAAEGFYLVSGICYQFKNKLFQTNVLLTRESANNITGENLQPMAKKEE